jgi:hypothetical protein
MCEPKIIHRFAGVMVLVSVVLGVWLSPYWFFLTAFVGANLVQFSFTGFCPLERILGRAHLAGCAPAPRRTT